MPMARNAITVFTALLLLFVAGVTGTGVAATDGPDTSDEVKTRIEALKWPVLERRETAWQVFVVKKILGVQTGTQAELYNDELHRAVTRYQQERDLAERNRVGTETWENLRYTFGVVRPGSTERNKVMAVQRALTKNGHPVKVDGYYGTDTTEAVRAFQRKVGIQVDGRTGRFTFRALICMGA